MFNDLFVFKFSKCARELIGAGGGLESATDTRETRDRLVYSHSDEKLCNALSISCTAACEFYSDYLVFFNIDVYFA